MTLFQDGDYIVEKEYDGKGLCPFDPDHNSTGVYSGEYIHIHSYGACRAPKFHQSYAYYVFVTICGVMEIKQAGCDSADLVPPVSAVFDICDLETSMRRPRDAIFILFTLAHEQLVTFRPNCRKG